MGINTIPLLTHTLTSEQKTAHKSYSTYRDNNFFIDTQHFNTFVVPRYEWFDLSHFSMGEEHRIFPI